MVLYAVTPPYHVVLLHNEEMVKQSQGKGDSSFEQLFPAEESRRSSLSGCSLSQ